MTFLSDLRRGMDWRRVLLKVFSMAMKSGGKYIEVRFKDLYSGTLEPEMKAEFVRIVGYEEDPLIQNLHVFCMGGGLFVAIHLPSYKNPASDTSGNLITPDFIRSSGLVNTYE